MKKQVPKSKCTRKIKWDRSVLKILTFWSRSKVRLVKAFSLSFFFFFFEAVRTGSAFRVGSGQIWTNGSAEDDVIHDVTALRARGAYAARVACVACVSAWLFLSARVSAWNWRQHRWILWRRVEARAWGFRPEISGFCWSKAVGDHGIVSFLKSWADLHRFERLGCGSSRVRGGACSRFWAWNFKVL